MRWATPIKDRLYAHPRFFSVVHLSSLSPLVWREVFGWLRAGKPSPAPGVVKRRIIRSYAKRFGVKTLVETGTYKGDTVATLLHSFDSIYSIELSPALYDQARRRFEGEPRVHLVHGDSASELQGIVKRLRSPAVFWLDGHWCGGDTGKGEEETPISQELACVLAADDLPHVILVDDARLFGVDLAYPTLDAVRALVASRGPGHKVAVADDIIRITP